MSERRSRITLVVASYYRSGKCEVCGKTAERSREFTGTSIPDCNRQRDAWHETPLRHKKCELLP